MSRSSHAKSRPTISVLCPTAHSGPLVAAVLDDLRAVVDEVIVAADSRVAAADLGHYAAIADRLLRYRYIGANRHWQWLAAEAAGDWLLLLDGDEIPSAALVGALAELVADRRVRQYSLPIHWPWPSPEHRLADEPWGSDRRLRLVRAHGLTFGAGLHVLANPDGPTAYRDDLPVYHLDLLLPDLARRKAKVARYDTQCFGMLTPEGVPCNEAFYLPENASHELSTILLPSEDARRVRRAVTAVPDAALRLDPDTLPVHAEEVVQHAPGGTLGDAAYRAAICLARPLPDFIAERRHHAVWVHVANNGSARFPGGDREPMIRVGVAWQPVDEGDRVDIGRAALPHPLEPGERLLMPVDVCAPPLAGSAELVLDLVHEHVRWFEQPLRCPVEVGASAANRLHAVVAGCGSLMALEEVRRVRREVGSCDGLLWTGIPRVGPRHRPIDELLRDPIVDGWSFDAATVDRLVELIRAQAPTTIVEFGSGTSTVVLASLLCDTDGARVISFATSSCLADRTSDALRARGLDHVAVVRALPTITATGVAVSSALSAETEHLLQRHPPDLVLVDAPMLDSRTPRLGTLDLLAQFARSEVTVLLDDALCDAGLCLAAEWTARADVSVHGIRATPKGLLEATLHPWVRTPTDRRRRFFDRVRG